MDTRRFNKSKNPNEEMIVLLENSMQYFSDEEFESLQKKLSQNNVYLMSFENRHPKGSLGDIGIFISKHATELIITGVIMPAVYEVIKASLKLIVYRIKERVKISQSGKIREIVPCLIFITQYGEVRAPIPINLPKEQFERYMDEVKNAIESIKPNPRIKYEYYIIEQNENTLQVEVKTILQYGQEQIKKQKKAKS